ncbi:MAG: hypothetical protein AABZ55_06335 [Bdellovibrionota bacterium]
MIRKNVEGARSAIQKLSDKTNNSVDIELNRSEFDRNLQVALPQGFPFYSLGQVELLNTSPELFTLLENPEHHFSAYRYHFKGEVQSALILFFDRDLDPGSFAEMGNIIDGKCASQLEKQHQFDVMITPPELMTVGQIRQIGLRRPQGLFKTYRYLVSDLSMNLKNKREIKFHVLILPMRMQEAGHA